MPSGCGAVPVGREVRQCAADCEGTGAGRDDGVPGDRSAPYFRHQRVGFLPREPESGGSSGYPSAASGGTTRRVGAVASSGITL